MVAQLVAYDTAVHEGAFIGLAHSAVCLAAVNANVVLRWAKRLR